MKYYVFKNSIGEEYLIPESNRKELILELEERFFISVDKYDENWSKDIERDYKEKIDLLIEWMCESLDFNLLEAEDIYESGDQELIEQLQTADINYLKNVYSTPYYPEYPHEI